MSNAIVKAPRERRADLLALFEKAKPSIAAVLPHHLTPEKLLKIVLSATSKTPALLTCSNESILLSVMQAASLGLEPNTPAGLCYLVPYKNKKTGKQECQLIPGYRGLAQLAVNSGEVSSVQARAVYANDSFELHFGTDERIVHRPKTSGDRGECIGAYAVAKMKDGSVVFDFMSLEELNDIRKRSKAKDFGPWVTDEVEMFKKTVVKRLCKSLPVAVEKADALYRATDMDNRADTGKAPDYSDVIDVVPELAEPEEPSAADSFAERVEAQA